MITSLTKKNKLYVLYKEDTVVAVGTKKELAELLNVQVDTISFYNSNCGKKKFFEGRHKYIVIGDEYDEQLND